MERIDSSYHLQDNPFQYTLPIADQSIAIKREETAAAVISHLRRNEPVSLLALILPRKSRQVVKLPKANLQS
jgi:hypothetical protein